MNGAGHAPAEGRRDESDLVLGDIVHLLLRRSWLIAGCALLAGVAGWGASFLMKPMFTATTTFLPPQQAQTGAAAALASLGPLAGLAGGAAGIRTPADQYVAMMQSVTAFDRIADAFKLGEVYGKQFRVDVRRTLAENVRMSVGKKDGLISVSVDDHEPQRAAAIANRFVDELRRMTSTIAVTEAQQRRMFFEQQLKATRDQLAQAQAVLQSSGFSQGALKAEPKAAAEAYARLRAEATAAEVRLQALRGSLADNTPEVRQQLATLSALRVQLGRAEQATVGDGGPDYVGRYREYKYQETLFELYARQFELARVDESREGTLIQVLDVATAPEKRSSPRRGAMAALAAFMGLVLAGSAVLAQALRRRRPPALA